MNEAGKLFYLYVVAKWYIRQMAHSIRQMVDSPNGTVAKWHIRQMAHTPHHAMLQYAEQLKAWLNWSKMQYSD
jgi:hypothetical protein